MHCLVRTFISTIIFATLLSALHQHFWNITSSTYAHSVRTRLTPVGPSYIWDLGELPHVMLDVQNTVNYQLNGSTADKQWDALVPGPLKGEVMLGETKEHYVVSMFHQLQCLNVIRVAYTDGSRGGNQTHSALTRHCLNYIRQMVMCRADVKLERVVDPNGAHAVQVREPQKCKNWRMVYERAAATKTATVDHSWSPDFVGVGIRSFSGADM